MRIVLAALAVSILAGCGIQPTGVVDAGEPAEGVPSGGVVYLLGPDRQLLAVQRAGLSTGNPREAVESLLAGPDDTERAAGYRTALPDGVTVLGEASVGAGIALTLSADPNGFAELALTQLGCTISGMLGGKLDSFAVTFQGAGGSPVLIPACPAL